MSKLITIPLHVLSWFFILQFLLSDDPASIGTGIAMVIVWGTATFKNS